MGRKAESTRQESGGLDSRGVGRGKVEGFDDESSAKKAGVRFCGSPLFRFPFSGFPFFGLGTHCRVGLMALRHRAPALSRAPWERSNLALSKTTFHAALILLNSTVRAPSNDFH